MRRLYSQPRRRKKATIPTSIATITPAMIQKAVVSPSPGTPTFMPHRLAMKVSGSTMTLNAVSTRRIVVDAVRDHGLVRVLERLHDLLVVLEHVPDPLGGVHDVVEVDLQLLAHVALLRALEVAQHGALRAG